MNIVLSNCAINNGNRGCVALSLTTMFLLDKLLEDHNVPHTFYLPQSGYSGIQKHIIDVDGISLKFNTIEDISCYSLRNMLKTIIHFKQSLATIKVLKNTDFILDIGQGDSFSDIYGKERFDWIYGQHQIGRRYNIPYCLLPQTIGPYEDTQIRKKAIKSLRSARVVMSRDKQSCDFVKAIAPDVAVKEIIDVAFFMPYKRKNFDKDKIHVGINISALLWHGGYTRNNQFGLKDDYQKTIRSIIETFLKMGNVQVHLVPHVVGGERSIENDYAVSYDLFEEYNNPNITLAPLFLDPISAKGYIAGMDFFIGARMHATIAAFSSGVPVVPMAYSRKFNGLFVDTLNYSHIVDLKTDASDIILSVVQNAFAERNQLKSHIAHQMKTVVENKRQLLLKELENLLLGENGDKQNIKK